jgi:hypothetical protein
VQSSWAKIERPIVPTSEPADFGTFVSRLRREWALPISGSAKVRVSWVPPDLAVSVGAFQVGATGKEFINSKALQTCAQGTTTNSCEPIWSKATSWTVAVIHT